MKEVVCKALKDIVSVNIVTDEKYYGVQIGDNIGFVTKKNYGCDNDDYEIRCFSGVTMGNSFGYNNLKLQDLICKVLRDRNCICHIFRWVYEFDTWQELLKWAIGEN